MEGQHHRSGEKGRGKRIREEEGRCFFFCDKFILTLFTFFHIISSLTDVTMAPSTIKLASGHEMPLVGFGLWKVPADQAAETVYNVCVSIEPILLPSRC